MTEMKKTGRNPARTVSLLLAGILGVALLSQFGGIIAIAAAAGAIAYGLALLRNKNPMELEA
jgi:predicted PurR-regulated permease PerM